MVDALYIPNIHAYTPKCIIVTYDIVDETVFGGERLKLLRLITNRLERHADTIHYNFLHGEYVNLGTHEFEKIKIRICDVTGKLLKADYPEIGTRIQLEFKESTSGSKVSIFLLSFNTVYNVQEYNSSSKIWMHILVLEVSQ